jgi:peptidoglycan/LPS O-acetylase OafA/YrhL
VPNANKPTIASLQVLRFIAALIVVLDHCGYVSGGMAERLGVQFDFPMFPGRLGVDVFFVISGFIMVYISSEGDGWASSPKDFFVNRWNRIVPVYLIATLSYIALYFASGNFNRWPPLQYLASALFVPYFDQVTHLPQPILSQGWTLDFEMFFYSLFALALFLPRRRGLGFLSAMFVGLVAAGKIWDVASGTSFVLTPAPVQPEFVIPRFWMHPIILEFLAGALLALARERLIATNRFREFSYPIALSACLMIAFIYLANRTVSLTADTSLVRFLCAVSVVAICTLTHNPAPLTRARALFVLLGNASYSLYLFHPHVLFLMSSIWKRIGPFLGMRIFVPIGVVASIGVSVLTYYFLEKKIASFLRSASKNKRMLQGRNA